MSPPAKLEICVDSLKGLEAAVEGGADRIELCSSLALGGLTPTPSLIVAAVQCDIPVRVMIRPHQGHFVFDAGDIALMKCDIDMVHQMGLEGVVLGANLADGQLDIKTLSELISASEGLKLTLHRSFDLTPEPFIALEQAIELGFDTILTSGCAKSALEGQDLIAQLQQKAAGRIDIMAGSGVTAHNIAQLQKTTQTPWFHGSASQVISHLSPDIGFAVCELGFWTQGMKQTDLSAVKALKAALYSSVETCE